MTFRPTPEQQAYFDWLSADEGNACINAVAGSGKTSTIVEGMRYTSGMPLFLAFNKKIASELTERLPRGEAKTFHALGLAAVRTVIRFPKVDSQKSYTVADQLSLRNGVRQAFVRGLSLVRQSGLGLVSPSDADLEELFDHHALLDGLPDETPSSEFCALVRRGLRLSDSMALASKAVVDFDDMLHIPLKLGVRWPAVDLVCVDEAQDTNAMRRQIVARLAQRGARVVAVGDPHQAIYGFTGADARGFQQMIDEFSMRSFPLTICWRCDADIIAAARRYVSHIRARDGAPAGIVRNAPLSELITSAAPGDAIVCRLNKPIIDLAFRFIRAGRSVRVEGRDLGASIITLTRRWRVSTISEFYAKLDAFFEREAAKLQDKPSRLRRLRDRQQTLEAVITGALSRGLTTIDELRSLVEHLFGDSERPSRDVITLSTVHKAKGLEWPRVWLLGRAQFMPWQYAEQDWELEQERNLIYVAITRAQHELVEVDYGSDR